VHSCRENKLILNHIITPPHDTTDFKKVLHGTWRNIDSSVVNWPSKRLAYNKFDSSNSFWTIKWLYRYNFKSEIKSFVKIDSGKIQWKESLNWFSTFRWYKFHTSYDTLYLSYDSTFNEQDIFFKVEVSSTTENWIEYLSPIEIFSYPSYRETISSFTNYNSHWYILTQDGDFKQINYSGFNISSYNFPNTDAFEISDDILYIAGPSYLELRTLSDTSLIQRYNLDDFIDAGIYGVRGLAVKDNMIYISSINGIFLCISDNGELIWKRNCNNDIRDMVFVNDRLFCLAERTFAVHEIDTLTLQSKKSYFLDSTVTINNHNFGPAFRGLAYRDGKLSCADFIGGYLKVWETQLP